MYGMFTYFVHFYGKCIGKGANTWMAWDYYRYFFASGKFLALLDVLPAKVQSQILRIEPIPPCIQVIFEKR